MTQGCFTEGILFNSILNEPLQTRLAEAKDPLTLAVLFFDTLRYPPALEFLPAMLIAASWPHEVLTYSLATPAMQTTLALPALPALPTILISSDPQHGNRLPSRPLHDPMLSEYGFQSSGVIATAED